MFRILKIAFLYLYLLFNNVYAQDYEFQSIIDFDIDLNLKDQFSYRFKNVENKINILTPKDQGSLDELLLSIYNLNEQQIENEWKITNSKLNQRVSDYAVLNNELYYYSGINRRDHTVSALYKYDLDTKKERRLVKLKKRLSFNNIDVINDSLILLHQIYPFHPADGIAKAQLFIFNVNSNEITDQKLIEFEGISLGNIVHEWVYINNNEIYLCSPFSGIIEKYDIRLKLLERKSMNLPDVDFTESKAFAQQWDSLLKESNQIFIKDKKNFSLPFFGKAKIHERMTQLRKQHVYIEKIMSFDEHTFLISLYKPSTNQKEFRCLFFVDNITFEVKRIIPNWRAMAPSNEETLHRVEDYFTIDLGNSRPLQPFFYKGKIYTINYYPISLFEASLTKKEMDVKIFRWRKENQLQFGIRIYQLL